MTKALIQDIDTMISEGTEKVRSDFKNIEDRYLQLQENVEHTFFQGEGLAQRVSNLRESHDQVRHRIHDLSQKLNHYKTYLDSLNS